MTSLSFRSTATTNTWGNLPLRMRLLSVTHDKSAAVWLSEALQADNATQIELASETQSAAAMTRLREETFDGLLVFHQADGFDALQFVEGFRAGGFEEPVIVLGHAPEATLGVLSYEVGADGYCSLESTTTRGLIWLLARAIQRFELVRQNRHLVDAEQQRLQYEHQEADRLLQQQQALVDNLQSLRAMAHNKSSQPAAGEIQATADDALLPAELTTRYRDMLRAHVMMGAGNLADEMRTLAAELATAQASAQQTLQLHVQAVEDLIQGLGGRSARHVMNRADLFVLDVVMQLADSFRLRQIQHFDAAG